VWKLFFERVCSHKMKNGPSRCSPSLKLLESNSDTAWRRKALIHFKSKTLLQPGKPYWRERFNTVGLLVLTSLDQLLFTLKILFSFFYKTSYLNEEVNCTELFPSVSVPCSNTQSIYIPSLRECLRCCRLRKKQCYITLSQVNVDTLTVKQHL
jgi:hypothetical protein